MLAQRDWEETAIVQELRHEQRQREMWLRYAGTTAVDQRQIFARRVEDRVKSELEKRGYTVALTTHKCPFDLWIGDIRCEVKGSNWQRSQRYQAHIRNCDADVLIFDAINGSHHYFIIPMADVGSRHTVEISSYDVDAYRGQWSRFLEAWDVLSEIVQGPGGAVQLALGVEP